MTAEETLAGKNCVITGGTRGLGETTAKYFAKLGAEVIITGTDEKRGRGIEASTKGIRFQASNLEDRVSTLKLVEWLESNCKKVDVFISNAARNSRYSITDLPVEEWDKMVNLNLGAPFLLSKWAARNMIANKTKGKIIIISAIQAYSPLDRSFPYVTTKGGLISMVRSMAADLGPHGILATAVLPGPFHVMDQEIDDALDSRSASFLRRMGRPLEYARLLAFLASDHNTFMTGNMIVIDGGRMISRRPDPDELRLSDLPDDSRYTWSSSGRGGREAGKKTVQGTQ
ncbi:MAG: SDR family oxidoreductase [Thaumarchaeota archaeon]|nr:SDR family oxidoreductase [Nitrososphaerota archaeon]